MFCNLHGAEQLPVLVIALVLADEQVQLVNQFALHQAERTTSSLLVQIHINYPWLKR